MSVPYSEYGWVMLRRLRARRPHREWPMRSANSLGPVLAWVCDACHQLTWTYAASDQTPTCTGGIQSRLPDRPEEDWE